MKGEKRPIEIRFDTVAAGFGIAFGQMLFGIVLLAIYLVVNLATDGFLTDLLNGR